jgi:hypothetical protein
MVIIASAIVSEARVALQRPTPFAASLRRRTYRRVPSTARLL